MAQQIVAEPIDKFPLLAERFIGVDTFGFQYFVNGNVFYKKEGLVVREFTDFRLGNITHADILNPLKIVLFFQNANVAVILDNKLSEIKRINFNELDPFRFINYVGTAGQNSLWIFNVDEQRLEVIGSNRKQNVIRTPPLKETVLGFANDYNYCWVFTKNSLKKYNIYGVLVKEHPIPAINQVHQDNENLVFLKDKKLFFLARNSKEPLEIKMPDLNVEQFYFNSEMLYIYSDQFVHQFKIVQEKKP